MKEWYDNQKNTCTCENKHYPLSTDTFVIKNGALHELRSYLHDNNYRNVLLVFDEQTERAAGKRVEALLAESDFRVKISLVPADEQGDVIADEVSLIHAQVDTDKETEVLIAVGAGTIHDITRFVSYKMGLPFISVPTAPSVDGFNSMGAPIVLRKKKITFQTHAPIALFAELAILCEAPQSMVAAGFGDMLGKYTSIADWKFGRLTGGEPYCQAAANMTMKALNTCIECIDQIGRRDEEGIKQLMTALIQSGLAMSLFGHSHPASGGEHHLSHFWEMKFLQEQRKQLLHGEKVGVSASLIADFYKNEVAAVLREDTQMDQVGVTEILNGIPEGDAMRGYLRTVGGKTTLDELGVEENLFNDSLKEAHQIRNRRTMLRYMNEK